MITTHAPPGFTRHPPPKANDNVSPDAVLQGVDTTLGFPDGVDVDAQRRIYVSNQFNNSIAVFARDASGDAVPVGTIAGAATGLSGPGEVAVLVGVLLENPCHHD